MRVVESRTIAIRKGEGAQDARGDGLQTLGGSRIDGFDLPVDKKGDPENGKERFIKPEHAGPPGAEDVTQPGQGESSASELSPRTEGYAVF